jgi:DNA-binding response OmpR family regulator
MEAKRILVIEDDGAIRRGIVDALAFHGFATLEAGDGGSGLEKALASAYDLLLLDLVLPGTGGLEILREVRRVRAAVPVIILTARGEEDDRVRGLRLGADDYVVKPFSVKELLARIEAVLRRSPERPSGPKEILIPGGVASPPRREVRFRDGERRELSELEMDLLAYLAGNAGRAVSREEILSRVWRVNPRGIETRTVDMHIARLREKLRDDPADPKVILTVRGKGYLFGPAPGPGGEADP